MFKTINKKDTVYYARIVPSTGIYEVCELSVRTISDSWFTGVETKGDRHAYILPYSECGVTVFEDRKDALKVVQEAEKNKKELSEEEYYEEY